MVSVSVMAQSWFPRTIQRAAWNPTSFQSAWTAGMQQDPVRLAAREDQDGRMATQGQRKNLRTFHAKIDPAVFDAGDRGLRDAAQFGLLDLAKSLKLPNNANGLAGGPRVSWRG